MFAKLFRKNTDKRTAENLYHAAVGQARTLVFYREWGVADTVDGRFDLIILHVFLILRCLKDSGSQSAVVQQALQEALFHDMDRSLREMGVGDMSIGKHIKKMAAAWFGRLEAYETSFNHGGTAEIKDSLLKNIYRGDNPGETALNNLISYIDHQMYHLTAIPLSGILEGNPVFITPCSLIHEADKMDHA